MAAIKTDAPNQHVSQTVGPVTESVKLPGGRLMEVWLGGDPAGYPLVLHHGTPADMTVYSDGMRSVEIAGSDLIARAALATQSLPGCLIVRSQTPLRTSRRFWIRLDTSRS